MALTLGAHPSSAGPQASRALACVLRHFRDPDAGVREARPQPRPTTTLPRQVHILLYDRPSLIRVNFAGRGRRGGGACCRAQGTPIGAPSTAIGWKCCLSCSSAKFHPCPPTPPLYHPRQRGLAAAGATLSPAELAGALLDAAAERSRAVNAAACRGLERIAASLSATEMAEARLVARLARLMGPAAGGGGIASGAAASATPPAAGAGGSAHVLAALTAVVEAAGAGLLPGLAPVLAGTAVDLLACLDWPTRRAASGLLQAAAGSVGPALVTAGGAGLCARLQVCRFGLAGGLGGVLLFRAHHATSLTHPTWPGRPGQAEVRQSEARARGSNGGTGHAATACAVCGRWRPGRKLAGPPGCTPASRAQPARQRGTVRWGRRHSRQLRQVCPRPCARRHPPRIFQSLTATSLSFHSPPTLPAAGERESPTGSCCRASARHTPGTIR